MHGRLILSFFLVGPIFLYGCYFLSPLGELIKSIDVVFNLFFSIGRQSFFWLTVYPRGVLLPRLVRTLFLVDRLVRTPYDICFLSDHGLRRGLIQSCNANYLGLREGKWWTGGRNNSHERLIRQSRTTYLPIRTKQETQAVLYSRDRDMPSYEAVTSYIWMRRNF